MNKKYKEIAEQFQIDEETGKKILLEIGIDKPNANPSNDKLNGFRSVCEAVKNGVLLEEAASRVKSDREALVETKSENKSGVTTAAGIGEESQAIGRSTGRQIAGIIPPLQRQGCNEVVEGFNKGLVEGFKEALEEINIIEVFDEFSDLDIEDMRQGKLPHGSNSAVLTPSNSESSPEA